MVRQCMTKVVQGERFPLLASHSASCHTITMHRTRLRIKEATSKHTKQCVNRHVSMNLHEKTVLVITPTSTVVWVSHPVGARQRNDPGQVVHTLVLITTQHIWYQSMAVMLCGWEGNCRPDAALVMHYRLQWSNHL